ncbi:MAG: hypothetical protein EXQ86_09255 [Rhodospirillales bacterium]|nr:hypothetical protein [Rhodospirillales bacterium]
MARILPAKAVPEFLKAYNVTEFGPDCPPEKLMIKVWDLYGTKPQDEANAPGTGQFVAAVVICDSCSRNVELDRARLSKPKA